LSTTEIFCFVRVRVFIRKLWEGEARKVAGGGGEGNALFENQGEIRGSVVGERAEGRWDFVIELRGSEVRP